MRFKECITGIQFTKTLDSLGETNISIKLDDSCNSMIDQYQSDQSLLFSIQWHVAGNCWLKFCIISLMNRSEYFHRLSNMYKNTLRGAFDFLVIVQTFQKQWELTPRGWVMGLRISSGQSALLQLLHLYQKLILFNLLNTSKSSLSFTLFIFHFFRLVYIIFYWLGIGTLLPWNMFITVRLNMSRRSNYFQSLIAGGGLLEHKVSYS